MLTGEADLNKDARISHTELYNYIRKNIKHKTSAQTPLKWDFHVDDEIIIAKNPKIDSTRSNVEFISHDIFTSDNIIIDGDSIRIVNPPKELLEKIKRSISVPVKKEYRKNLLMKEPEKKEKTLEQLRNTEQQSKDISDLLKITAQSPFVRNIDAGELTISRQDLIQKKELTDRRYRRTYYVELMSMVNSTNMQIDTLLNSLQIDERSMSFYKSRQFLHYTESWLRHFDHMKEPAIGSKIESVQKICGELQDLMSELREIDPQSDKFTQVCHEIRDYLYKLIKIAEYNLVESE